MPQATSLHSGGRCSTHAHCRRARAPSRWNSGDHILRQICEAERGVVPGAAVRSVKEQVHQQPQHHRVIARSDGLRRGFRERRRGRWRRRRPAALDHRRGRPPREEVQIHGPPVGEVQVSEPRKDERDFAADLAQRVTPHRVRGSVAHTRRPTDLYIHTRVRCAQDEPLDARGQDARTHNDGSDVKDSQQRSQQRKERAREAVERAPKKVQARPEGLGNTMLQRRRRREESRYNF